MYKSQNIFLMIVQHSVLNNAQIIVFSHLCKYKLDIVCQTMNIMVHACMKHKQVY